MLANELKYKALSLKATGEWHSNQFTLFFGATLVSPFLFVHNTWRAIWLIHGEEHRFDSVTERFGPIIDEKATRKLVVGDYLAKLRKYKVYC